jgi:hypothetical protein
MAFGGKPRQRTVVRPRLSVTGSPAAAGRACSIGSSPDWLARALSRKIDDRRHLPQIPQDGGKPPEEGAVLPRIGRTKGSLSLKFRAA